MLNFGGHREHLLESSGTAQLERCDHLLSGNIYTYISPTSKRYFHEVVQKTLTRLGAGNSPVLRRAAARAEAPGSGPQRRLPTGMTAAHGRLALRIKAQADREAVHPGLGLLSHFPAKDRPGSSPFFFCAQPSGALPQRSEQKRVHPPT